MRVRALLLAAALLAALGSARADPIGPVCPNGSCFGNVFTLEYTALTPTDYRIFLSINTGTTTLSALDFIAQVAFKPANNSDAITALTLLATTAPGVWPPQPSLGGLNNGGCTTGSAGFVCSSSTSNLAYTDGSTYSWLFDVQVASAASWLDDLLEASVKVNYGPANGLLTSENITLQRRVPPPDDDPDPRDLPEPGTLALAGLGLLSLFYVARRRKYR